MPLILPGNVASAIGGGYNVDNSMRINSGSSSRLSKTFSGNANSRTTFTISAWFKRSKLGATQDLISAYRSSDGFQTDIMRFGSTDDFEFYAHSSNSSGNADIQTNRLFRDVAAWYHVVVRVDTTQGTDTNRVRIYVNGTQETSFSSSNYMNQNGEVIWGIGSGVEHTIGAVGTSNYFGGYVAEVVYLDGQSLDASSFGEFDEDSPTIWKAKDVSGLTFANNSFYLNFGNSSELGTDVSGLSNTFTENNIDAQDQSTDTCTNNFAVMNSLTAEDTSNFAEGNLKINLDTNDDSVMSTFAVSKGKWYWEAKRTAQGGRGYDGVASFDNPQIGGNAARDGSTVYAYTNHNGAMNAQGGTVNSNTKGSALSNGDIICYAFDADNGQLWATVDGNIDTSGTANVTGLSTSESYFYFFEDSGSGTTTVELNFGSPTFSISSGNADGDGYGNFEYSVPSGFYSLCTKNLAEYG